MYGVNGSDNVLRLKMITCDSPSIQKRLCQIRRKQLFEKSLWLGTLGTFSKLGLQPTSLLAFWLLVAMPRAPGSVLAPSSDALCSY